MDEVRNPFAPGAGTQPPELAGRDGPSHGDIDFTVPLFADYLNRSREIDRGA